MILQSFWNNSGCSGTVLEYHSRTRVLTAIGDAVGKLPGDWHVGVTGRCNFNTSLQEVSQVSHWIQLMRSNTA